MAPVNLFRLEIEWVRRPFLIQIQEGFNVSPFPNYLNPILQTCPFTYSLARKERFWNSLGKKLNPNTKFRMTLHTGAGLRSKCWPQENFSALIEKCLTLPGIEIVLIGTAAEKELLLLK